VADYRQAMELNALTELYQKRLAERGPRILDFFSGRRDWLVLQRPSGSVWGECNTIRDICANNMKQMESWLSFPWTDEMPQLQPWIGVGAYASAFGCEYLWRTGEAPDARTRYNHIEDVRGITCPDWRSSPVLKMVLEAIDALKEVSGGRFPISTTDPQSPYDTATLVLDTSEFFTACYTEAETVNELLNAVTDLFIAFTEVQFDRIGEGRVSRPGHNIPSLPALQGVTLSDDNLAVASPLINERFSIPMNRRIAERFGGVFIHCCGTYDTTMRLLPPDVVTGIDCAISTACDPTPNAPEAVRAAMNGRGIIVKARFGPDLDDVLRVLPRIAGPGIRIMVDIMRAESNDEAYLRMAERSYRAVNDALMRLYDR
jgi:hypothetical protein